ncbi:uncharacterized protein LOC124279298 [Haliotis rubra]|uniref:uncharacterized protein LOC124279298 n=1 Tax=Haliotis rubra TaxID=36100 RepID=UPI001EE5D4A2|nr:uncharacterized protein LOC124279298 [Haliotis rubra]
MGCTSSRIASAEDQSYIRDEGTNCPICLGSIKQPKTLQCQHSLCSRCLQRYINSLDNTDKLRGFHCPICRKLTIIANPDTPRQTWVSQLQESEQVEPTPVPNRNSRLTDTGTTKHPARARDNDVIKSNVRGESFEPLIVDIVVVDVDDVAVVVVADFNNKSLKSLYRQRGRDEFSSLSLESNPFCLALISDSTVALTLPWSDKICITKVTPGLCVNKSIETDKAYYAIAGIDEDCLAVSTTWQTPCSVDIIDHSGRVIKTIDTTDYGDSLFSDPWYMAVTPSGDILVSDCQEQSLLCLDQSGHTRWRYKPRGNIMLKIPAGVACDNEGNIYLADTDRHCVITLDEHGRFLREAASSADGVERPRCITVTDAGRMYVTMENGDIRIINLR